MTLVTMLERVLTYLRKRERREEIQIAVQAEQWLKTEACNVALAKMRADVIDVWRKSKDAESQKNAWLMLWAIDAFVDQLKALVVNEQVEQAKEQQADVRQRALL